MSSKEDSEIDKFVSSTAKGVTEGFLNWSKKEIKDFVKRLRNRDIAFIEDDETIDIAKEMRKKGEWIFFKEYIDDGYSRILFQMGLTLRKLEKEEEGDKLEDLRKKILKKYNKKGLHITQFIQNGLFNRYMITVLERDLNSRRIKPEINNLFENIDDIVIFIRTNHKPELKAKEIITKIHANSPKTYIISSAGSAMSVCEKIKDNVLSQLTNYEIEYYESIDKKIYFLNRVDEI